MLTVKIKSFTKNCINKICKYITGYFSDSSREDSSGERPESTEVSGEDIFSPHSGVPNDMSVMKMSTRTQYENVEFRDQMPTYQSNVDSGSDPTRYLQDANDATLDHFFSRPIKVFEQEWGTGTTLAFDFDPWSEYFNNKRVVNRIANYNLLRAKLHVKVVINGNGFQYGRAICAYQPLDGFDDLSTFSALVPSDLVQTSQLPHIYLDPTTSTGGEMELPFFYFKNYMSIPEADWQAMGQLYFRSLNSLQHANGATDQVTISIFAWASDVSTSVLTSQNPLTISAQSGKESEIDEANRTGVISGPASAVAKISNALSVLPPIRPYALATSEAAGAVARVAKSMGYCRPAVTKNPDPLRPTPTSHLAATDVPDTALKLTIDDKQELSIDPRIAGLGPSDPMSIKEIAKRESYLTKFAWNIGTAPETLLWNARIDPVTWAEDTGPPQSFHFPACCMAALPFKFWTGSMRFRFQVVCSAFHKGRLKIVYDPNFLDSNEYNTNYLQVVDIADTQDFTIEIGNGQPYTLLNHHEPGFDSVTQMYSTTAYTAQEQGNGVVGVYVVNELTTPNSTVTNDIEVNVFVSMGDDFEVFVPDNKFQNFVFKPPGTPSFAALKAQSGSEEVVSEAQNTAEPSAPLQQLADGVGPTLQDNALINMVYTGESIMSFRQLLKRYNLWRRELAANVLAPVQWLGVRTAFPFLRGSVTGAVDLTAAALSYNYCNTVLLHWVTMAFSSYRGGIRYKMMINNRSIENADADPNLQTSLYVERVPLNDGLYSNTKVAYPVYASSAEASVEVIPGGGNQALTGTRGQLFATTEINPTAEFEVPYYSPLRFTPGKQQDLTTGATLSEGFQFIMTGTMSNREVVDFHVAAAEDFQVYFWTGLPRMYFESAPPPA